MKNKFLLIASLAIIGVTTFVACNKTEQISDQNLSIMSSQLDSFDLIRLNSHTMHNDYMHSALSAYNSNLLGVDYTLNNLNNQLSWSENYFSNYIQSNNVSQVWDSIESNSINNYNSTNLAITNSYLNIQNLPNSAYKDYLNDILDAIKSMCSGDTTVDLNLICDNVFIQMKSNQNISVENKKALASIIGVCEGSYEFWTLNIDSWPQGNIPDDLSNSGDNGGPQLMMSRIKKLRIASFLAADGMGAMEGALMGSAVPIYGTVGGAVLGGALASGATAWFW